MIGILIFSLEMQLVYHRPHMMEMISMIYSNVELCVEH